MIRLYNTLHFLPKRKELKMNRNVFFLIISVIFLKSEAQASGRDKYGIWFDVPQSFSKMCFVRPGKVRSEPQRNSTQIQTNESCFKVIGAWVSKDIVDDSHIWFKVVFQNGRMGFVAGGLLIPDVGGKGVPFSPYIPADNNELALIERSFSADLASVHGSNTNEQGKPESAVTDNEEFPEPVAGVESIDVGYHAVRLNKNDLGFKDININEQILLVQYWDANSCWNTGCEFLSRVYQKKEFGMIEDKTLCGAIPHRSEISVFRRDQKVYLLVTGNTSGITYWKIYEWGRQGLVRVLDRFFSEEMVNAGFKKDTESFMSLPDETCKE